MQGAKTSLSDSEVKHKATVQALKEIAMGKINLSSDQSSTEELLLEELSKLDELDSFDKTESGE